MRNYFCYSLKMVIFPILRYQYWTFLYCSPFSYRSSNFAIAKVVALSLFASIIVLVLKIGSWLLFCIASHIVIALLRSERRQRKVTVIFSLSPLRARKGDDYRYRDSWKRDNFRERARKELIQKRMQRGLRVITLQGAIEKSPILLS